MQALLKWKSPPFLKRRSMNNPCDQCIVRAGCTKRCIEYAQYLYENKDYSFDKVIRVRLDEMGYKKAVKFILMEENIALEISDLEREI